MAKRGFRVMDSDLHTMEPDDLWQRYLDEPFRKYAPTFARRSEGPPNQPTIRIGDLTIGEMTLRAPSVRAAADLQQRAFARHPHYDVAVAREYDTTSHLQAMDIEGIDVAILYGTRGRQVLMHDDLEPELAAALARAHNNWTHDYCAVDPVRLKFAAQVAFHDVALAVREARRAVRDLGAAAVVGNPNPVKGRHIHDPYFEPLWDALEELGVPVGFHPTGLSSLRDDIAQRMLDHPNGRMIGTAARNPMELMLAFASLAAGGVLERHPGLRCAFLEGTCGWLPWWLWRLDEAWEKFGPGSEVRISALPSDYFFRQCYVATDADEKVLRQVVEAVGDDNIVVSTDYPHSDGLFPEAINEFLALEGISDKTKAKILWDNCARLYPLAAQSS
ncbi:MAG: amidohydrolase [Candidatus Rokubacteria bacterium]|nr:amidohydrolase [Candidatus Rokubacteria bacterium]